MAQEGISKYFGRKRTEVKRVSKDDGARLSICKEVGGDKEELVERWLSRLGGLGKHEDQGGIDCEGKTGSLDEDVESRDDVEEEGGTRRMERKERICQFGEMSSQGVKGALVEIHVYLPRTAQKLVKIFRVLQTIQRFNMERGLSTIFIKSVRCIEDLVKHRVEESDIERMNWVSPESFEFKRISILHGEKEVSTFTIHVTGDYMDLGGKLLVHVRKCHERFLEESGTGWTGHGFHPEFDFEDVVFPRRPLFPPDGGVETVGPEEEPGPRPAKRSMESEERGKRRASSVLERIRERERSRKEEFLNRCKEEEDDAVLNRRIQSLFMSEGRKAMSVERVAEVLKIFDGPRTIRRLVVSEGSLFHIRNIRDTEYLVSNGPTQ